MKLHLYYNVMNASIGCKIKSPIILQVDTLRAAVDYIKTLRELLGEPLGKVICLIEALSSI